MIIQENFSSDWIFKKVLQGGKKRPNFAENPKLFSDAIKAERLFQRTLFKEKRESNRLYKLFIETLGDKNNLRGVRVYFRIRQSLNYVQVYGNIKEKNIEGLKSVPINASMVEWLLRKYQGRNRKELEKIFEVYKVNRNKFILNNSPMILRVSSMAKRNVPKNLLPEIGSSAYVAAIEAFDKYVPKFTKEGEAIYTNNILSCISSRIKASMGLMLASRGVYLGFRGRKNLFKIPRMRAEGKTDQQISKELKISIDEIKTLQQSSNIEYSDTNPLKKSPDESTPESIYAGTERMDKLKDIIAGLTLLEKKFLVLRNLASVEILTI